MTPGIQDLTIQQQVTFPFRLTTSCDLSQYDGVRMQIRTKPNNPDVVWDSKNGGLTFGANDGTDKDTHPYQISILIPAWITAGFNFKTAGYDLDLIKTGNPDYVAKLLTGAVALVPAYTKPFVNTTP